MIIKDAARPGGAKQCLNDIITFDIHAELSMCSFQQLASDTSSDMCEPNVG